MVLEFTNKVTLVGGSAKLREGCLVEVLDYSLLYSLNIISEDDSSELIVTTRYYPLDNPILDLAAKYLALDFVVEFKPKSSTLLKDWNGCIRVVDQMLFFSDNYEALEGYELGSIYQLKAKGGFPECLRDFHS